MRDALKDKELLRVALSENAAAVEKEMARILRRSGTDRSGYENLVEAMEYSSYAGGKRIRPFLCLEFCRVFGGGDKALAYAAAVELLHTSSLIHDDLPAMDDDDMRRGKPSNHKAFGEATAILAGDGLMILCFEAAASSPYCDGGKNALATALLAKNAGVDGMVGGQQIDLNSEGREIELSMLQKMHSLKTAALISASCALGCIAAGASAEDTENAQSFGRELGLAFQIRDDILDCEGTEEQMGKTLGKDANAEKNTYVSLMGLEKAKAEAEKLTASAINRLTALRPSCEAGETAKSRIEALCRYLLIRNN